jgi:hypothetical protein
MIIVRIIGIFIIMFFLMSFITGLIPSIAVEPKEQLIFCGIVSVIFGIIDGD